MAIRCVAAAVLLATALSGCSTSRWRYIRERPERETETLVTVRSVPPGAEVTLNGNYVGDSPLEIVVRYAAEVRVYQRRNAFPYPHVEDKEVPTYTRNRFTFHFAMVGYAPAERTLTLSGEAEAGVRVKLAPLTSD